MTRQSKLSVQDKIILFSFLKKALVHFTCRGLDFFFLRRLIDYLIHTRFNSVLKIFNANCILGCTKSKN